VLFDKSLPLIVINSQQGSMEKCIFEYLGVRVDLAIFFSDLERDAYLNTPENKKYLAKSTKVVYNYNEAYSYIENTYMTQGQDINIFTNWRFQQGNQGTWQNDHRRFKILLGQRGTMCAHAAAGMLMDTRKSIYADLSNSDTPYIVVGTEQRFIPPIGIRSGYYITSNRPSTGKTIVKGYDKVERTVNLKDYPAGLPLAFDGTTLELMDTIRKNRTGVFDQFKEQDTSVGRNQENIVWPKSRHIGWDKKVFRLKSKDPLPSSKVSLILPLTGYTDTEKRSRCSQMDLSITRAWLAINGILDGRSAGSLCRNIPMWRTDVVYDDESFYTNYPEFNKHRDVICEYASKVKTNV